MSDKELAELGRAAGHDAAMAVHYRKKYEQEAAENEVLREQNFAMNKSLAAKDAEIARLQGINQQICKDHNSYLVNNARFSEENTRLKESLHRVTQYLDNRAAHLVGTLDEVSNYGRGMAREAGDAAKIARHLSNTTLSQLSAPEGDSINGN